jgi:hypothetical protein
MPVGREVCVEVRVFSGESGGGASPTLNHPPVTMLDVRIEPGVSFRQLLPASDNAFVDVLAGAPKIGDAGTLVQVNPLAWPTRSDEPGSSELTLKSESTAVRLFDLQAKTTTGGGGEILKFVGDGALAIFPVVNPDEAAGAAGNALAAALGVLRARAFPTGEPPLEIVIALHHGAVLYGNVGAADRLDSR